MVTFGLGLFPTEPPRKMVALAKLAEDLGFACAYIGDSQMIWREAYVILGAAAQATSRITLASGVTNPITRDPSVLAAAWDTLHELTGGRTLFGIGMGDSSLETLGKKPATLARLEQSILIVRDLIAGQTVTHPDSQAPVHITYARRGTRVPIYIGVSSPKIHRLAGKVADGAIVLVGIDKPYLEASRRELEAGAAQAGRNLRAEGFRVVCWVPCSIQEDGKAARSAVKAHVARILKRPLPFELDAATREIVRRIYEHYEYYEHMVAGTAHGELVTDELVEKFAIAGTPAEAHQQFQRLAATGLVDEIAIIPHTQDPVDRERIIRTVGEMIASVSGA
ncbi:MAG: LLM class flavin-dependent oxidoreductase [Chloroflexi bacterium]|nr:LLM class flavin-dependent oxidoreductase [Chloroflexota bacterium]